MFALKPVRALRQAIILTLVTTVLFSCVETMPTVAAKTAPATENSVKTALTDEKISQLLKRFGDEFPSFLMGNGYDGAPVLLFPFGKYKYTGIPPKEQQDFVDFLDYVMGTGLGQVVGKSEEGAGFIMDFDGFSLNNFGSTRGMRIALNLFRITGKLASVLNYGIIINGNFATQIFFNITRPFLGELPAGLRSMGIIRNAGYLDF